MPTSHPPQDYEELIRIIHDRHDQMSKTYQRIAVYLTQNPNEVAVHSVNAIAERCGIHASSFVRFAQSLGYKGFKEMQAVFQRRLSTAAPGCAPWRLRHWAFAWAWPMPRRPPPPKSRLWTA